VNRREAYYVQRIVLSVCLLCAGAWAATFTPSVVDDFEGGFTNVPDVGDVANGWSAWDWGPRAIYAGLNFSKFDPDVDDEVSGQTIVVGVDLECSTEAVGDDVQVIAVGASGVLPTDVCVSAGLDGVLQTENQPDVWAAQVAGQSGGSAQKITTKVGTRGLVRSFAVTPGQDYIISVKMNVEALGVMNENKGLVAWGYDLSGQMTDPTPFGPDASETGTVQYRDIWNIAGVFGNPEMVQVTRQGWFGSYLRCKATGAAISIWLKIDDQSEDVGDGYSLTVDDVAITSYTPDDVNLIWNGDLELRDPARPGIPAGFLAREEYVDEGWWYNGQVYGDLDSLAEAGRDVFDGEYGVAMGRKTEDSTGTEGGITTIVGDLKDNATYRFRINVQENIVSRPNNVGPQGGVFLQYNTTGEINQYFETDLIGNYPYGLGITQDPDYTHWSYPYQGVGWWTYQTTINTGDFHAGVDDERLMLTFYCYNVKMRTLTNVDCISLTEVAVEEKAAPFIAISNVADGGVVSPAGELTVTWDTDVSSSSIVEYGTTEALGSTTGSVGVDTFSHSVPLSGLNPAADFYYRVRSEETDYLPATSPQHRILVPNASLVNPGFEGSWWSRTEPPAITTGRYSHDSPPAPSGLCETTAAGDDVQVIPVDQGAPNVVCIVAGSDGVLDTTVVGGDDQIVGDTVTTGANGICETDGHNDDDQGIDQGDGQEYAVCITAGPNGVLDTHPAEGNWTTVDTRPEGWEFWGYTHGDFPGFFIDEGGGVTWTLGKKGNGALYGYDATALLNQKANVGSVHGGVSAMGLDTCVTNNGERGGLLQVLQTESGSDYAASVWISGYDDYLSDPYAGHQNVAARLGVDPMGGSDPTAGTVVWTDFYYFGAPDDVQEIPFGQGKPDALNIEPGVLWSDYTLESTPAGDDATLSVLFWGLDLVLDTAPAGDDYVSSQDWWPGTDVIHPGPNGVIDSTPVNDDVVVTVITAGADGISDTTPDLNDLPIIFDVGWGTPDAVCITAGPDGILSSSPGENPAPSDDDQIVGDTVTTGVDGVCGSNASVDLGDEHLPNNDWNRIELIVTAGSGKATMFLEGLSVYGAQTEANDHGIWFDDAEFGLSIESMTWDSAQAGWNLMSLPIDPADPDPAVVFGDLATCGNVIGTNLYRYSKTSGYELYPTQFTAMETGRAYWLRLTSVCNNTVTGTLLSAPQTIALDDGWNMFGMPLSTPVLWSGCQITDGVDTKSIADAGTAGWIQTLIYYYTPAGYKSVKPDGTGDDDSLRPWVGYWFLTYQAGLSLIVQ